MRCELCGKECSEFGDAGGAIVCARCLGWYGESPNSEVDRLLDEASALERNGQRQPRDYWD